MTEKIQQIPSTALKLLEWVCPEHLREEIEGDLIQKFNRDSEVWGLAIAKRKSIVNSICYFRPGIVLRKNNFLPFNRMTINPFAYSFDFKKANDFIGWIVFCIALLTYSLTLEETASFWDCSEFIATSYKLQVPHPPGAPLFLMLGRMFSFLAFGDVTKVAYAINMMSALASAFTILFLYWSIVLIGKKIAGSLKQLENQWLLFTAGAVGSLAYAFSDTFWFSAVEAEVYAMSSLFTAFVIWAMLKWESIEDRGRANRWLILIAYATGLSIGVHLLNLLTLPALALIFYFKSFKATRAGIIITLLLSLVLVLTINDFIIPGLPSVAGYFELFFVNTLGLFFGSGAIVFILLLMSSLILAIRYSQQHNKPALNTFSLAFTFILIGYCSYAAVIIRSNFDPLINENAPKDVMSFVRYLKREQYGSRPLIYGPNFTSQPVAPRYGETIYVKGQEKYEASGRKYGVAYLPGDETFLPRAWDQNRKDDYERILGLREGQRPSFFQNISFMLRYQMGTMYARYFMWNFAGRSSDELGADWLRPSDWFKKFPSALAANKARNNFFMIPFILGLIGMFYHFTRDVKGSAVIALLFVMLGAAIVVYLNSPPSEPRERDYIYAGSYYAFAIWIGLSVIGIMEGLMQIVKNRKVALVTASVVGMLAPVLMIAQGWDDHDRSDRFFSVDAAYNELNSCEKNGILFTGGDNDTFPLWYAQETENCRQDLRVLVLSYCSADWYIDQTTRQAHTSTPFKYTLAPRDYKQSGNNNYIPYADFKIKSIDANEYLNLLAKEYPQLRIEGHNLVPSKVITLSIDKNAVLAKGIVPKEMEDLVVEKMELRLKGDALEKADLLLLDLLATNHWERPIYLNATSLSQVNFDLSQYLVQEGNTYRILPVKNPRADRPYLVDTKRTYDLMLNKFKYRKLDDPSVYYTNDYKMQVANHRSNLNSLAEALIDKGEIEKASHVLDFSLTKMPDNAIPYDPSVADTVNLLFKVGQKNKAVGIAEVVGARAVEHAAYEVAEENGVTFELRKNLFLLSSMQRSLSENQEVELARTFGNEYERLIGLLQSKNVIQND